MGTQKNQTPAPTPVTIVPAAMTTQEGKPHWGIIIGSIALALAAVVGGGYYYVTQMMPSLAQEEISLVPGPELNEDTYTPVASPDAPVATVAELEALLAVIVETNLDTEVTSLGQSF